jgi:hypothetical protein
MIGASFDSTKTPLQELLVRADSGSLQLPDFQRDWVWDDERIRSLITSVSVSFPIGAVMLLQTGGDHIRFKLRLLAGVPRRTIVGDAFRWLCDIPWFLMQLIEDPPFVREFFPILQEWSMRMIELSLEIGVDVVQCRGWYEIST